MITVVFIGGYARSGKSSLLQELESRGYQVLSTSRLLDEVTDRTLTALNIPVPTEQEERRRLKIAMAEEVLVPCFTRSVLTDGIVRLIDLYKDIVFIETIGGEEFNLLAETLEQSPHVKDTISVNVRRRTEKKGIDIRELLPHACALENTAKTVDEWKQWGADALLQSVKWSIESEKSEAW